MSTLTPAFRLALVLLLPLLLLALQACGGGDEPPPEADKTTQPLNCTLYPELCK